jgi:LEA14-like dessication related protein
MWAGWRDCRSHWVPRCIGACAVAAALAGCVPGTVRDLDVTAIRAVHILHVDPQTLALEVTVELRNDHRVGVTVERLEFDLALARAAFASGALTRPARLDARASSTVVVPLAVACRDVARADFETLFEPRVPYHLRGHAIVATPLGRRRTTVDARGTIPAPAQWRVALLDEGAFRLVSLRGAGIASLGLETSEGVLGLVVEKPFSFPLPLKRFEYRVDIEGRVAGEGALPGARELAPGPNRFDLPVRTHPVDAVDGVLRGVLGARLPSSRMRARLVLGRGERELAVDFELRAT